MSVAADRSRQSNPGQPFGDLVTNALFFADRGWNPAQPKQGFGKCRHAPERTTAFRNAARLSILPAACQTVGVMRKSVGLVLVVVGACGGSVDDGSPQPFNSAGNHGGGKGGKGSGAGGTTGSVGGTTSSVGGVGGSVGGRGGTSPGGRGGFGGFGGVGGGGGDLIGGAGGTSGAGGAPPDLPWEVTLVMDPFRVEPGRDTYMCQDFANPFGGYAVEIGEFESHMTKGSHHLVLNAREGATDGPPTPCGGLEVPSGPFATQARDDRLTYPEGVAAPLSGSTGFHINSHYFNASNETFEASVKVTLRRVSPDTVRSHAFSSIAIAFNVSVPAHSTGSAGGSMQLGNSVELLWLMPHMHMHGTRFTVDMGGTRILDTPDWETPPFRYDPTISVGASQSLDYRCEYNNETSTPLSFGESAANNEMCILIAQYYTPNKL